jgi:hypothetical protein
MPSLVGTSKVITRLVKAHADHRSLHDDAPPLGALHIDPPFGSNWQYLASGRKTWCCLSVDGAGAFSLDAYDAAAARSKARRCQLHHSG